MSSDECAIDDSFFRENSEIDVKSTLQNRKVYESEGSNHYVIAAVPRPIQDKEGNIHSEFILLVERNSNGKTPMENLIKSKYNCVVFYTYSSPCLQNCLNHHSIMPQLQEYSRQLEGKKKVFAFTDLYYHDSITHHQTVKNERQTEFKKINELFTLYRCPKKTNIIEICIACWGVDERMNDQCLIDTVTK